jgi:hypothetical protein
VITKQLSDHSRNSSRIRTQYKVLTNGFQQYVVESTPKLQGTASYVYAEGVAVASNEFGCFKKYFPRLLHIKVSKAHNDMKARLTF